MLRKVFLIFLLIALSKQYILRSPENEVNYNLLCINKGANEYFRLSAESECREVVQCSERGLIYLRCPHGLSFDIEKQTCDWKHNVVNCNQVEKTKVPYLLNYNMTFCEIDKLFCQNGQCIDKTLFCDGKSDCADNSDETYCQKEIDTSKAPVCNKENCKLPECYCSLDGTEIPNGLEPNKVPQMIMITFDDAINNNNIDIYNELFRYGRNNPNGCSIKGTCFMSHKYSNYSAVENLSHRGHEIAVHSITHRSREDYWSRGSTETWAKEMAGARLIYERFGNIKKDKIVGVRAPLLKVGGNNQFEMMEDNSFLYDSSLSAPLSNTPIWPYTLHHRMPHFCYGNGQNCPTKSYPVWEIVMNEYDRRENPETDQRLSGCVMVDQCSNILDGQLLYRFLENNFDRHYNSNRAPLGLYFHASFFLNPELLEAFTTWIDEKSKNPDVYFVTMEQVIRWMQNPTELKDIQNFEPWRRQCNVYRDTCQLPNQCPLTTKEIPGETIRLHSCQLCPSSYPFIENPLGLPME